MKKIRLLLTFLASMLAIGSYAQTEDPWVEYCKNKLLEFYPYLDGYIYSPSNTIVYCQAFSYTEDTEDKKSYHPMREDLTLNLDRSKGLWFISDFGFVMKGDKSITEDQRPELNNPITGILTNKYENVFTLNGKSVLNSVYSKWSSGDMAQTPRPLDIYLVKGGQYHFSVNNGVEEPYEANILVNATAECRVDIKQPLTLNSSVEVKTTFASGYPYTVANYQGKTMNIEVLDASGKKVYWKYDIKIDAPTGHEDLEYVVEDVFNLNDVASTKYTFKLWGGLLEKELVITKEVLPDFSLLNAAIAEAEALCEQVMNDPDKASFCANKVEKLKKEIEIAREALKLKVDKQKEINNATDRLSGFIGSLRTTYQKEIANVGNVQDLIKAIGDDPWGSPTIQLTNDIDLSGVEGTLKYSFGGIINGSKPDGSTYALTGAEHYLFEMTTGAQYSNLTFKNAVVQNKDNDLGVIARKAYNCVFENIHMESITVECQGSNAGSITGYAENCEFNHIYIEGVKFVNTYDKLIITSRSLVTANSSYAGSITGTSLRCSFNDCQNDMTVGIYASASCGGFTGKSTQDSFQDCKTEALVGASQNNLGGIAGESKDSKFLQCYNTGTILPGAKGEFNKCWQGSAFTSVSGFDTTGGICGLAENGSLEQCSNFSYRKTYGKAGGLLGKGIKVSINNCLNAPDSEDKTLSSTTCAGFINVSNDCKITNSLNAIDSKLVASGTTNSESQNNYSRLNPNSTRKAASYEMCINLGNNVEYNLLRTGQVARWLNNGLENRTAGVEPWRQYVYIDERDDHDLNFDQYPVLDPSHRAVTIEQLTQTYGAIISDATQLLNFIKDVNGGNQFARASLAADIDCSEMPGAIWEPIGKDEPGMHYRGIFDGRGHTIKGLKITSTEAVGLFGAVHANAEIRNVIIEDSEFTNVIDGNTGTGGDKGAGSIVGKVYIGWTWGTVIIDNCGSYADVNAVQHAGGILGRVDTDGNLVKVIVNNCWSMGTVTAQKGNDNNGNSGLLCGYMKNHGEVSNCWSGGQLRSAKGYNNPPYSYVNSNNNEGEFLVGYSQKLDIKDCYIFDPVFHVDRYSEHTLQAGVEVVSDEDLSSGEFCYKLNKGVVDGTQTWYQTLGKGGDPCPVRTKLTDGSGTDIVFGIFDSEGNITGYGNTSHEEITNVILGIWEFEAHRVTDVNKSGDVDVTDVTTFTKAATMK